MILSLQSYFDLGFSSGLNDEIFRLSSRTIVPKFPEQGLCNPLGPGLVIDLKVYAPRLVEQWRQTAKENVHRPLMELGYTKAPNISDELHAQLCASFKEELMTHIQQHLIETCELTIYGTGTVFVRMDHASGIPTPFLHGFYKCYEFAAYNVEVARPLWEIARNIAAQVEGTQDNSLWALSQRPEPTIHMLTLGYQDPGYQEFLIFSRFACVGLCIDETDNIAEILKGLHGVEGKDLVVLPFAYLGRLHFGWAACVLEPMIPTAGAQDAYSKIARMLHCIQIAHVLLGTCEAFGNLFQQEIISQVDSHVKGLASKRTAREYNRLRTLALAVVSLTDYSLISVDNEDQNYFSAWEKHAKLAERRRRIQEQCEVLHNVQETETIREESTREWWLSCIVLFLTAFTFISVVADSYNFIEYKKGWWQLWTNRMAVLSVIFIIIIFVNTIILIRLRRMTHRV